MHPRRPLQVQPKPPLPTFQRLPPEAPRLVHHRHMHQPNPRGPRRRQNPAAHLGRIVVPAPARRVVQVVELANTGEARLQHLDVELRGDRFHVVRRQAPEKLVHHLAPAPERVRPPPFGQPRERPLERMTVHVGHPGHRPSRHRLAPVQNAPRLQRRDPPGGVHLDPDIARPAVPDQEPLEAEGTERGGRRRQFLPPSSRASSLRHARSSRAGRDCPPRPGLVHLAIQRSRVHQSGSEGGCGAGGSPHDTRRNFLKSPHDEPRPDPAEATETTHARNPMGPALDRCPPGDHDRPVARHRARRRDRRQRWPHRVGGTGRRPPRGAG